MVQRKVAKYGDSKVVLIPAVFAESLGLEKGSPISIEMRNDSIVITPCKEK